jgi:hypothetical protein
MAHSVKFGIRDRDRGNVDIEFDVKGRSGKIGELHLSKGGIDWFPKNAHVPISLGWAELAKLIEVQTLARLRPRGGYSAGAAFYPDAGSARST